jgi:threonine synthase
LQSRVRRVKKWQAEPAHLGGGNILDPYTAGALHVAQAHSADAFPVVTLSLAHPAKFSATVENATGAHPVLPLKTGELMENYEDFVILYHDQTVVESLILTHLKRRTL